MPQDTVRSDLLAANPDQVKSKRSVFVADAVDMVDIRCGSATLK